MGQQYTLHNEHLRRPFSLRLQHTLMALALINPMGLNFEDWHVDTTKRAFRRVDPQPDAFSVLNSLLEKDDYQGGDV